MRLTYYGGGIRILIVKIFFIKWKLDFSDLETGCFISIAWMTQAVDSIKNRQFL